MSGSSIQILYDGDDITSYVMLAQTQFSVVMAGGPGTFTLRCKDPYSVLDFVTGREIVLIVDNVRIFGGFVMQVGRTYAFPADYIPEGGISEFRNRIWEIHGVNYNILFDKRVLRDTSNYLTNGLTVPVPVYDGDIIRNTFPNYFDLPVEMDFTTYVDNVFEFTTDNTKNDVYQFPTQGTSMRRVLDDFSFNYTGALVYIDANWNLHYEAVNTLTKRWGFSDTPNNASISSSTGGFQDATVGMRGLSSTEDATGMVNDAFVWGGGVWSNDPATTFFARVEDPTSIGLHNRWQYSEVHMGQAGYSVPAMVEATAQRIVNGSEDAILLGQNVGSKWPQYQLKVTWFASDVPYLDGQRDHINPGELLTFKLYVLGDDGLPLNLLLPCRSINISFPSNDADGDSYVQFDGYFGLQQDDPYQLWRYIRQVATTSVNELTQIVNNESTSAIYGAEYFDSPSPATDGVTTAFTIPFPYIAESTDVLLNGLSQRVGVDYMESDPPGGEITFLAAPLSNDSILVRCRTA